MPWLQDTAKVDSMVKQATAGAKVLKPAAYRFDGDRSGSLEDSFGHVWHVWTQTEDQSAEELQQRAAAQHR